jgi:hypothetical protein
MNERKIKEWLCPEPNERAVIFPHIYVTVIVTGNIIINNRVLYAIPTWEFGYS